MKTMFKVLSFAAILAVAAAPAAHADTDLTDFHLTQGPGIYYGTGNGGTNHGLDVVTTGGGLQLGLGAITPQVGPIAPSGNTYLYTPGIGPAAGTGTPPLPANYATWDFVFSVNTGGATLSAYTYLITVTDVTTTQSGSFHPTTLLPDNAYANGSTVICNGTPSCAYSGTYNGFQNAENLSFGNPLFNPNAADTYKIELTAFSGLTAVATDTINVVPTPEPSSLIFLGTGLLGGIGTMIRRRRIA